MATLGNKGTKSVHLIYKMNATFEHVEVVTDLLGTTLLKLPDGTVLPVLSAEVTTEGGYHPSGPQHITIEATAPPHFFMNKKMISDD